MPPEEASAVDPIVLFLCGDVMTGRGIDQILPSPCPPILYESYMTDARGYVELAQSTSGQIASPVDLDYIWGDALGELDRVQPDVRIINLETSITRSDEPWPRKGIHYRMSPENAASLVRARIDVCTLANNHVLDWGYPGLQETLDTLSRLGIASCGAGRNDAEAAAPAAVDLGAKGRVLVFSVCTSDSGIPERWAARANRPGLAVLPDLSAETSRRLLEQIGHHAGVGDLVVLSIHWGPNWGHRISRQQVEFARSLAGDPLHLIHGHSSHHAKAFEIHRGQPILYGCGDLLTDYEGIHHHEEFRGELGLMYFASFAAQSGLLTRLVMTPTRVERLRIVRASRDDASWLRTSIERAGRRFGTALTLLPDGRLDARLPHRDPPASQQLAVARQRTTWRCRNGRW